MKLRNIRKFVFTHYRKIIYEYIIRNYEKTN